MKRFIHFSSIHALHPQPADSPADEACELNLDSPLVYEKSKALAEKIVLEYNSSRFQIVVLNPTAILGPFDFGPSYLGQVILKIYRGLFAKVWPGQWNGLKNMNTFEP